MFNGELRIYTSTIKSACCQPRSYQNVSLSSILVNRSFFFLHFVNAWFQFCKAERKEAVEKIELEASVFHFLFCFIFVSKKSRLEIHAKEIFQNKRTDSCGVLFISEGLKQKRERLSN